MTALNVGPAPITATAYSPAIAGYGDSPQVISWGPSSNHAYKSPGDYPAGVVIHMYVDGSVQGITSDVDPTTYMRLITIAGREPYPIPD